MMEYLSNLPLVLPWIPAHNTAVPVYQLINIGHAGFSSVSRAVRSCLAFGRVASFRRSVPERRHHVDGVHERMADGRELPVEDCYYAGLGWVENLQ